MNNRDHTIIKISIQCWAFTLFLYKIAATWLPCLGGPSWLAVLISFVAMLGGFYVIFQGFFFLYDKYLFNYFHPEYNFDKEWFHITFIEGPEKDLRHGKVEFLGHFNGLSLSGTNNNISGEYRSSLHSNIISTNDKNLLIQYTSFGAHRPDKKRDGVMWLIIEGRTTPNYLKGYWSDVHPSEYHGSIVLFKNKKEFDEELKKAIARRKLEKDNKVPLLIPQRNDIKDEGHKL